MASNSVTTSKNNYTLTLSVVENSTSVADNTSNITATLTLKANGPYIKQNRMWGNITVDGAWVAGYDDSYDLPSSYGSVPLKTYSGDVAHNADGAKTITVTATLDTTDGALPNPGSATVSVDLTLSTIPRKSEIASVTFTDDAIERGFSISFTPASTSFTHRVEVIADGEMVASRDGYSAGSVISFTADELLALYRKNVKTVTVRLITKTNGSNIGTDDESKTLSAVGNAHIKVGGEWKRGVIYVGSAPGVVMIKQNGEWRVAR